MTLRPLSFLQLSFLFFCCLFSLGTLVNNSHLCAQEYVAPRVVSIEIAPQNLNANTTFNTNEVMTKIQTKCGALFSQNEFDDDLKKLAAEYDRVEPYLSYDEEGISILLNIWFKPVIRTITFSGNVKLPTDALMKELEVTAGDLFDREKFCTGFNKMKAYYIKKGYFEADLAFEVVSLPGDAEIDIIISADEGRAGYIVKIEFVGFTSCEEDELRDLIMTRKYFPYLSWYNGRGIYHPEMIEHDRGTVLSYLQNEGFADAMVTVSLRECSAKNRVVLTFEADRGPCYSFGSISLLGNCLFSLEELQSCFAIYENYAYSPEGLRTTIQALRDKYGACGYIDVAIDTQLSLHPEAPIYDVSIVIEEGNPYLVGMVRVFGNCITQTRVILNETLLCPGEVFDLRKLEGTEARLTNTAYFSDVNTYAVRTSRNEEGYRDVYIEVEEQDTGNLGIFFGFNSLQHIFGGIDVTENNFNALGIFDLPSRGPRALRGGGEYLHLKTSIGKRETSYLLQWTIPYFLDSPWILGFDLEKVYNRELSRGYEVKTYGGDVHATYIQNDFLKYDFYYRARHSSVSVRGKNNPPELNQEAGIHGFISAVGSTLIYDSTDRPRRPTQGFRSRFLYEFAGVGGNFDFMKFFYLNTYYYPVSRNGVLKFRADLQFIHAWGHTRPKTLPLSEKLYLGGDNTVRGYRPFIIGPKFGPNEPAGGVSAYLLSEEYQYNLLDSPCLDLFVFVDAGYVSASEFTLGRPNASFGAGIRIEALKNMPMTIGYGIPLQPTETQIVNGKKIFFDNAQRFFFTFGGTF